MKGRKEGRIYRNERMAARKEGHARKDMKGRKEGRK
jgi:hypothetical protein